MPAPTLRHGLRRIAATAALGALAGSLAVGTAAAASHGRPDTAAARARPALHSPPVWSARTSGRVPVVTEAHVRRHGAHPSPYRADVAYPVLHGTGPAIARIDAAVRDRARTAVARFVHHLPRGPLPKGATNEPSTLSTTVRTELLTARLAGFSDLTDDFPTGAAHGTASITTELFDLETGRRVPLDALFRPGTNVAAFLSQQSRSQLLARLRHFGDRRTILQGTAPKAANFTAWSLTPFGLEVTFGDYQVGPYAIGTPTIRIPFSRLDPLARPGGPIHLAEATRPARMALLPATTPPATAECFRAAGPRAVFPPARCLDGRLDVATWDQFVDYGARVLHLGRTATAAQVHAALCADGHRLELGVTGGRRLLAVATAYDGWHFAHSPLAGYPKRCPH